MSDLRVISRLADYQIRLEGEIEKLEERLKEVKRLHQKVSESDLPEAMDAAEMLEFTLRDGRKITIEESIHASIPKDPERREVVFQYLREAGYAAIIKRVISVAFGVGEDRNARNFLRRLQRSKTLVDNEIKDDENVHHSTLKVALRELREDGNDIPDEMGMYVRRYAKIK